MHIISNLNWECKKLSEKVTFLDLDINIKKSKTFDYKVHAKEEALALCIQPHSAHPSNTSRGMVFILLKHIVHTVVTRLIIQCKQINYLMTY